MRYYTVLSKKECFKVLKDNLDSRLRFGRNRFVGWRLGRFFSVTYIRGDEFKRKMGPIQNKAIGYLIEQENATKIDYIIFRGWTDPISIALSYVFCIATLAFVDRIAISSRTFEDYLSIANVVSIIMIGISFFCTIISEEGRSGKKDIEHFFEEKFHINKH